MNWEAIGEIIGAAAVVLTLLYLARETRKNAQALDATSTRELGLRLSDWHRQAAQDPNLSRIVRKASRAEMHAYTADEWWEFRLVTVSLFPTFQTTFTQMGLDLGNCEESENYIRTARGVFDSFPANRRFGDDEASAGTFTQGFIDAINSATRAPVFDYYHRGQALLARR